MVANCREKTARSLSSTFGPKPGIFSSAFRPPVLTSSIDERGVPHLLQPASDCPGVVRFEGAGDGLAGAVPDRVLRTS